MGEALLTRRGGGKYKEVICQRTPDYKDQERYTDSSGIEYSIHYAWEGLDFARNDYCFYFYQDSNSSATGYANGSAYYEYRNGINVVHEVSSSLIGRNIIIIDTTNGRVDAYSRYSDTFLIFLIVKMNKY